MSESGGANPLSFLTSVFKFSVSTWLNALMLGAATVAAGFLLPTDVLGGYGRFVTASTTLMNVAALGLDHAYIRFYHGPPPGVRDSRQLAGFCMTLSLSSLLLLSLPILFLFSDRIGQLFFERQHPLLVSAMCVNAFFLLVTRYFNITYRMQNNVAMFTLQSILLQFFTRVFYLFGAVYRPDLSTVVVFSLCGLGLFTLIFFLIQKKNMLPERLFIGRGASSPLLRYGLGLAPAGILLWGNTLFSRTYVNEMLGGHASGIFTYAGELASMIAILQGGFANFWSAFIFKNYRTDQRRIARVHDYMMFGLTVMMALLILFTPPLFWILSQNMIESRPIFGLMLLIPMLLILSETTVYGINIAKKTFFDTIGIGISLIGNAALSIRLIPAYGLFGAAIASVISSAAMFLFRTAVAQRFYRTIPSFLKTAFSLSMTAGLSLASYLLDGRRLLLSLLAAAVLLVSLFLYRSEFLRLAALAKTGLRLLGRPGRSGGTGESG